MGLQLPVASLRSQYRVIQRTEYVVKRGEKRLLLDHPHSDLGLHIRMQLDRNAIDPERLDRVVKVDETLVDVEALCGELLRDVGRRHRPEQLAFLANTRREGELHLLELPGEISRAVATLVLCHLEAPPLRADALEVARRCLEREAAGQEEVACIAVLDRDDVPGMSEVLDRPPKNDFHDRTL